VQSQRVQNIVEQQPLSDRTIAEIRLLSEIARANHSHVSIQDIAAITLAGLDEPHVRIALETTPGFRSSFDLKHDLVVDRTERISEASLMANLRERKSRAEHFIQSARSFQRFCRARERIVLCVSGSTSYYSVMPGDDLDFFIITKDRGLWVFLFKSLILARIYRLLHPEFPKICFSYAIDEGYARDAFAADDLLFARDALNAVVLYGENFYRLLLKENPWIAKYFPQLYQLKTQPRLEENPSPNTSTPPLSHFLNLFLYSTFGPYLRVKSALLNRSLRRQHLTGAMFTVRSGPDHFIFESIRYQRLRHMYDKLGKVIHPAPTADIGK